MLDLWPERVYERRYGETTLCFAIVSNEEDIAMLLINRGVDIHSKDKVSKEGCMSAIPRNTT
jgi:hypothetical protein